MNLIVGVDPGTTVGWAAVDWDGRLVAKGSERNLDRDALIAKFVKLGRVVLVGTDKAKVPSLVQEVATAFGARTQSPADDLRKEEKRALVEGYGSLGQHELDALASALFAKRQKDALVRRIRVVLERAGRSDLFDAVVGLVLIDRMSINTALGVFERRDEKEDAEKPASNEQGELRFIEAVARANQEARRLRVRAERAEEMACRLEEALRRANRRLLGLVRPKVPAEIGRIKDAQIQSLTHRFENAEQKARSLAAVQSAFEKAVLSGRYVAVPYLRSLAKGERQVSASVIYVDDAGRISDNTVNRLHKGGVELAVCQKLPHRKLPFAVVEAKEVIVGVQSALLRRDWLDSVRSSREVLAKVVEEYQKARLQE